LSDEKLRTDMDFSLWRTQALYLLFWQSFIDSPEGQKWPMNQLEMRFGTSNWVEIFSRSISYEDHSFPKISAEKNHSKWEIESMHFTHPKHLIDRSISQTTAQMSVPLYDAISRCLLCLWYLIICLLSTTFWIP